MAKKQTRVNPAVLKDLVDFMNNPPGGGDMLRSVYDVGNTGTVDQAKDSDTLDGQHAADFAAASHAGAHQNGGADELSVAGLSGELADPQPPKTHTHPGGDVTSQVGDAHTVDGSHAADFAPASKGVTNGDGHDHKQRRGRGPNCGGRAIAVGRHCGQPQHEPGTASLQRPQTTLPSSFAETGPGRPRPAAEGWATSSRSAPTT